MKKELWFAVGLVALAALVLAIVFFLRPSEEPEHPATVVETVNRVDAHPRSKGDWEPAFVEMMIYGGGQVRTGAASSARLEMLEGVVQLSADSVFTVKKSTTSQEKLVTTVSLDQGRLWAHLSSDQLHAFTVETGNAVAAVRDTRFSVDVAGGVTLVSVAEGRVELTAQEQSVTVTAEQQAVVRPDQPPSPPQPMSDEERTLWATEGGMPELAPPFEGEMWVDVWCVLSGPAGDPDSRNPGTNLNADIAGAVVSQVVVESPDGEVITLPPYSDFWGGEQRFFKSRPGLPLAGGTYTFTALNADGTPIPGAVAYDVYLGGNEPDPPADVQAEVVEDGILVTWSPSPAIPGAFDPGTSPELGFYKIGLWSEGGETVYGWGPIERPLSETSHVIPFRRQDFERGASGRALDELDDGLYFIYMDVYSVAPAGSAGYGLECEAHGDDGGIRVVVEGGQPRVEVP